MEDVAIIVRGLRKSYGGSLVLDGVSLEIPRGSIVGIVGPNGCGKSTLLRILAGVEDYDEGVVEVRGRPALVPQETILLPWRTLRGNIMLAAKIRRVPREVAEKRMLEAASILGLTDYLNMYPREVSGGTARKASILMALVLLPDILLLDEPFTGLDRDSIAALQETIARLRRAYKLTVVVVSHMLDELYSLSERIFVMSHRPSKIVRIEEGAGLRFNLRASKG
ncbi:MAG: ATP-binding cassette domain-containing protein [Desulfurococcales archaeon]|nr:ATP-binding cassette domain-containing protein [Desulfurococcales archaeon]